ncbi:MAG: prepilin-type N-terminal cleavage/methylation domain-containing protein [Candidatus Omnitrophica bacterium]|nr:prepilin-type N-terminal cleavage/methylation domain-containing protein [Candidatus Omnitrophota bacterium]
MRGFTLVEIMVTSVVLAILIVSLFLVLSIGQRSWLNADVSIQLRQEIARSIIVMGQELNETSPAKINITLNSPASSVVFKIPQDLNGDGYVVTTAGDIEWSPNITYSLNASNRIQRAVSGGATTIIANNITGLQFTRTQNETIQVNLTASKVSNTGRLVQDTGEFVVKLRN